MTWIAKNLWLIPVLPLLAAGFSSLLKQSQRKAAASLAIGSLGISFLLACCAFAATLHAPAHGEVFRQFQNFTWLQFGENSLRLGWVLDPLTAIMLVMVTFVGLLIFIYSIGYMAHDENFTRFFCFLALFAAAMLGIVIANNLLLLFISWELVGLASYLLIGFWYHKPSAAAAAKKAFITTRIGDMGFLIGMLWLYSKTGTLLFYDGGNGCLEASTLAKAFPILGFGSMSLLGIALLIFVGAMGKSGQFPLHVWLPDAMEGPTPVSALIHAATMVAAGVFLVARVFALMKPDWSAIAGPNALVSLPPPDATIVITWIGAITAVFAALIAVAQTDIKRILAYSTVSQLGFMMIGLGTGGVAVGMFHLITHAFFKALLFMGAGSIIHSCHEEQDIRRMGGLKKFMPATFATYAIGMMALSGVPLFFSGFWSKDEILHAAHNWSVSQIPFYLAAFGALLTAFYMTRQMCYVFFGNRSSRREEAHSNSELGTQNAEFKSEPPHVGCYDKEVPHESPRVMTVPLMILAAFTVLLGMVGTPAWPWFESYLNGHHATFDLGKLFESETLSTMILSTVIVAIGIGSAWVIYSKAANKPAGEPDALEKIQPAAFNLLRNKFFIDELYGKTILRLNTTFTKFSDWLDRAVWGGIVKAFSGLTVGLSWFSRTVDEQVVNLGFDQGCDSIRESSKTVSKIQNGKVQNYLRYIGVALVVLALALIWGCSR
jgi:NADH-quinone oxidoreductase subunit L